MRTPHCTCHCNCSVGKGVTGTEAIFSPVIIPLAIGAESAELAEGVGVEFGPPDAALFNPGLGRAEGATY